MKGQVASRDVVHNKVQAIVSLEGVVKMHLGKHKQTSMRIKRKYKRS